MGSLIRMCQYRQVMFLESIYSRHVEWPGTQSLAYPETGNRIHQKVYVQNTRSAASCKEFVFVFPQDFGSILEIALRDPRIEMGVVSFPPYEEFVLVGLPVVHMTHQ